MRTDAGLTRLLGGPSSFVLQFGKYRRKTLYEIGGSLDGLKYLHWAALNYPDGKTRARLLEYLRREPQFSYLAEAGLRLPVASISS